MSADIERPASVPQFGTVPAFDAGWEAHEVGLERETVEVLSNPGNRAWELLGWDIREALTPR